MKYGKRNDHMVEKLSDNIFRIDEFSGANCYLVAGSERALLIDSGVGAGDLRGVAESLTDLPIELAVTHAHVDHIGGAWQFDKVYVPKVDINGFNRFQTKALVRKLFVATQPEMKKAGLSAKDVKGNSLKTEWVPIEDGHIFDLGEKP